MRTFRVGEKTVWLNERDWRLLCDRFDPAKLARVYQSHPGYPLGNEVRCHLCDEHRSDCSCCPLGPEPLGCEGAIKYHLGAIPNAVDWLIDQWGIRVWTPKGLALLRRLHRKLAALPRKARRTKEPPA